MAFSGLSSFNSLVGKNAIGYGVPTTPSGLTLISSTSNSVTISFTAPSNYGGLTYSTNIGTGNGTPTSYAINGLSLGSNSITITATNIYGTSVASGTFVVSISNPVTTITTVTTITSGPFYFTALPSAVVTVIGTGTAGTATASDATNASIATTINGPSSVAADNKGNYYVCAFAGNQVIKVDNNGAVTVLITTITNPFFCIIDPASYDVLYINNVAFTILYKYVISTNTLTTYFTPSGYTFTSIPAIDGSGNIYFGASTAAVYKITTSSATQVAVSAPSTFGAWTAGTTGCIVDKLNNLYVYDWTKNTILKLDVVKNTWSLFFNFNTVATTSFSSSSGGQFDSYGNLYMSFTLASGTTYSFNIIEITSQSTWAFIGGNYGSAYYSVGTRSYTAGTWGEENVLPGGTAFPYLNSIGMDLSNNIIIPDRMNHRVRKIYTNVPGTMYTIAGNFNSNATSGDGGFARLASLSTCRFLFVDKYFNIYVSSDVAARLRKIDGTSGIITTIAGTGTNGNTTTANAIAASSAIGTGLGCCVVDTSMNIYFADFTNKVIRMIDQFGIMNTIGGPYTPNVYAMTIDNNNNVYWVPNAGATGTVSFYMYSPSAVTTIYTLAAGYNFQSNGIYGMAVDTSNNVYLSDTASTTAVTTRILKYNIGTNTTSVLTSTMGSYCIWQMVYNPSNNSLYCGTNSTGTSGRICYISCSTGVITPITTSSNTVYNNMYGTYNEVYSNNYATNFMTGMAIDSIGNIYTCGGVAGTGTNASRIDVITPIPRSYPINESIPIPATVQFDASTLSSGNNIIIRTTTAANSNFVQSWTDTTNTYTAIQATTTNQPLYTYNGLNSKDVITFNGATGQILTTGAMPANTTNQITLFFVMNMSSFTKTFNQFFSSDNAYISGVIHLLVTSSGVIRITLNSTNTNNDTLTLTAGTNYILMVNLSTASGSWQSYARLNGVSSNIYTHGGTQALVCSANWNIGNWAGDTTRTMTGRMGEMIVYYRDLSTTEIQTVEQYLARKWSINIDKPYYFDYGKQIANITNMGNTNAVSNLTTGYYVMTANNFSYDGKFGIILGPNATGTLYTTINYGQTWTARTKPTTSQCFALGTSGTGRYCLFPTYGAGIYYSKDYGVTWTLSNAPTTQNFAGTASNGSGKYWIITTGSTRGGLYYSSNYGATWTASNVITGRWDGIAMSETGQFCFAATGGNGSPAGSGFLYSSNYGVTWTAGTPTPTQTAYNNANGFNVPLFSNGSMSSSGRYCYVASATNGNWYSWNYGQSWTQSTMNGAINQIDFSSAQCSYDGKYVVVTPTQIFSSQNKGVFISSNYGQTYNKTSFLATAFITALNMSKDLRYYFYNNAGVDGNGAGNGIYYGSNPIISAVPGYPTALTFISSTTTTVTFSFTPPSAEVFSNISPIQNTNTYTAYVNGTVTTNSFGTPSSFTITGLTIGTTYTITITATNIVGTSLQSTSAIMSTTLPMLWFKMNPDDITDTTLQNYGSAGNATVVGSPAITFTSPVTNYPYNYGYALQMGSGNYITLPTMSFNSSRRYTLSLWVNFSTLVPTNTTIFALNNATGLAGNLALTINNTTPSYLSFYYQNGPTAASNYFYNVGNTLADGNFHHLVIVFGGTSSTIMNVYFDNFQLRSASVTTASNTSLLTNITNSFTLASCNFAYIGNATWDAAQYFSGTLGEVRLYNIGFTDSDVNYIYNLITSNAPKNLQYIMATSTSITITFTAPTGTVSSYIPYVNGSIGTGSGSATSYTITGLVANTTYTISMAANLSGGLTTQPSSSINVQTIVTQADFGVQTWYNTNRTTGGFNNQIAMSYSGKYGIATAAASPGGAHYTNNYGLTWTVSNINTVALYGCAISGTGQYGILGGYDARAGVYYSKNYGKTWTVSSITTQNWAGSAMSYDGRYAIIASGNTQVGLRYSSNYGVTWTASNLTAGGAQGMAMSYSGQYCCCAGISVGSITGIYYSSNYGQTWTKVFTPIAGGYNAISMSADGQYGIASSYAGVYYSTNNCQTWQATSTTAMATGQIMGARVIATGLAVTSGPSSTAVYYSTNAGQTLAIATGNTTLLWNGFGLSQNGQLLWASSNNNGTNVGIRYTISSVPSEPTMLTLLGTTSTSITISFNAPPGPITSYAAFANTASATGSGNNISYTITGLTAGKIYAITMTATNARGTSIQSIPLVVSTPGTSVDSGPSPPTVLTIINKTSTTITFRFTPPSGVITTYIPYINGGVVKGSGSESSYTITNAPSGQSCKVNIAALITSTGLSGQSDSFTVVTFITPVTAPAIPTGLTFISATTSSITIGFTEPSIEVTSYTPYINGTLATGSITTPTSYTITGLTSGTAYTCNLSATNGIGTSAQSSTISIGTIPTAPTGLTFISATNSSITFSFTSPGLVTSYTPYINGILATGSGTSSSYTITGLPVPGTTYTVTIGANNIYGSSAISTGVTMITSGSNPYATSANIHVAYGMYLIVPTYTGAVVNIRRSSDSVTSDFYADATQSYLTTGSGGTGTTYSSWIGANTGSITTWYNQAGGTNHATQVTASQQPTVFLTNSKYVASFVPASSRYLNMATPINAKTCFVNLFGTTIALNTIIGASTSVDFQVRLVAGAFNVNTGDWFFAGSGTKLAYLNNVAVNSGGATNTATVTASTWNVLSLSVATPSATNFGIIGSGFLPTTRGWNGYITGIICHNTTMDELSMKEFYIRRLI